MYYVYALIDVRTNLPFYIGKGLKVNERHLDHFNESIESTSNRHKLFKINHLKSLGHFIPVDILVDNIVDENEAYEIETEFIKKYGRENIDHDGILTNICLDNRPPSWEGKKQSSEHIVNRVASYIKTCKIVGRKPHSEETKRKIARPGIFNPFNGKTHSEEFKKAHSNRMKGNKNNSKEYIFISPDNIEYIVIGEFYKFCNTHNLTISTMEKALKKNKMPKYGKCKGWKVQKRKNNDD
jgi:hypothetical protein